MLFRHVASEIRGLLTTLSKHFFKMYQSIESVSLLFEKHVGSLNIESSLKKSDFVSDIEAVSSLILQASAVIESDEGFHQAEQEGSYLILCL